MLHSRIRQVLPIDVGVESTADGSDQAARNSTRCVSQQEKRNAPER